MHYFTGTTMECYEQINRGGFLLTEPPKRVWKEYSENYIYLIPFDPKDEEARQEAFTFAVEQASFAAYAFDHEKRVVLEIEGIDETLLDSDPDGRGIGAVRYPMDISTAYIHQVHIEKKEKTKKIWELIAITHYLRKQEEKTLKLSHFDWYYDASEEEKRHFFLEMGIKHLELVDEWVLTDEHEMIARYDDLMQEVEYDSEFEEMTTRHAV